MKVWRFEKMFIWGYGLFIIAAIILLLIALFAGGCQRGDVKLSLVVEGQPAPHDGWNFGPESYLIQGEPAKVTGGLFWMKHLDPNSLN